MRSIPMMLAAAMMIPMLLAGASACEMTTSDPKLDTGATPAGRDYEVDTFGCPDCILALFVYEESNGIDGLQRGDELVDDTCGGTAALPDAPIF